MCLWEVTQRTKKFLFLDSYEIADELLAGGGCMVEDSLVLRLDLDSIDEEVVDSVVMFSDFGVSISVAIFNDRLWVAILKY